MLKTASECIMALCLVCCSVGTASAQGKGGGGGGGGSVKPVTLRWVGNITAIVRTEGGFLVTVGTSYYAVGTGFVDANTKIKLNGSSGSFTGEDLRVGDLAQMDVLWPSRTTVKMEVTGLR